jgi:hypothetical protein
MVRSRCGFLHVPKAAGSSIRSALTAAYPTASTSRYSYDHVLFGHFDRYDTFAPGLRAITLLPDDQPDRTDVALIVGHFAVQTLTRFVEVGDIFTVLREPRARVLSHQLFWSTRTAAATERYGEYQVERTAVDGMKRFLTNPAGVHQYDNLHVRMLCGDDLPTDRALSSAELADATSAASATLHALGAVTFVESPAFWPDVANFVGLTGDEPHENVTGSNDVPVSFSGPQFDAETLELLHLATVGDAALYREVVATHLGLDADNAQRHADGSFVAQVERYSRHVSRSEADRRHSETGTAPPTGVDEPTPRGPWRRLRRSDARQR